MTVKDADLQKIKELIEIMKSNDLIEIQIEHGDSKVLLKRSGPQQTTVTAIPVAGAIQEQAVVAAGAQVQGGVPASVPEKSEDEGLLEIKSPLVGTFYEASSPDSEAFVKAGSSVEPQSVVCIIEAMKVMNEVKAELSGTIVKRMVKNGQAVEYGQVLFKVKPD